MPETERLEKYLNKTYQLQLNAEIVLTVKPQVTLDFSVLEREEFLPSSNNPDRLPFDGDAGFDAFPVIPSVEELAFVPLRDRNADINVYVLAGTMIYAWAKLNFAQAEHPEWIGIPAWGIAKRLTREVWVDGDMSIADLVGYGSGDVLKQHFMRTVAHEMGHVIMDNGHPDDGQGPAPLSGTDHSERLMVSGGGSDRSNVRGNRLVKGEWDAAERWLQDVPYPPIEP
jgi:hypothetical protein